MAVPTSPVRHRLGRAAVATFVPVLAVALGLAVGAIAVIAAGESPITAYGELARGAVGTTSNLGATLSRAVPIVVAGVGLAIAFRAGCFNLGGEGQMVVGAVTCAAVANGFAGLPVAALLPLVVLAGCAAAALWALLPALLQVRFAVPLLITTLLLNYVAVLAASYLVSYPLRDLTGGAAVAQTAMIPEGLQLPPLGGIGRLHAGFLAVLVLPVLAGWLQGRTVLGYEMRMTGHNRLFAEYGGVDQGRTVVTTMLLSGVICGFAGVLVVLGTHHRYVDLSITGPGYAWSGFTAALLALANPIGTAIAGLFLAGLDVGAAGMERRTDVPIQIVDVVQAAIIMAVAVRLTIGRRLGRRLGVR